MYNHQSKNKPVFKRKKDDMFYQPLKCWVCSCDRPNSFCLLRSLTLFHSHRSFCGSQWSVPRFINLIFWTWIASHPSIILWSWVDIRMELVSNHSDDQVEPTIHELQLEVLLTNIDKQLENRIIFQLHVFVLQSRKFSLETCILCW